MREMMVAHALVRLKTAGSDIVPEEQCAGAFTGFMSSVSPRQDQLKPYYFATLPKPPSKAVVYSLMEKAQSAARGKGMPFIQFVRDQPVYAHVVEIKYENPEMFSYILPVLGSFHTQMCFMKTIYLFIYLQANKRIEHRRSISRIRLNCSGVRGKGIECN